ncbi:MAG: protein BatD [Rhodothermales bacterium]|nr:protein BatD [Rhodothermales bacterium]MBO6779514.1 protein BatD [Rhodothermales bacterium]
MSKKTGRILLLLALLTQIGSAQAQIRVLASVSEPTIGTEETVAYTLEVRGVRSLDTPAPPETDGLALAQSFPSRQTSMSIVNGAVTQSISFSWIYRPIREGQATFQGVTISVNGSQYTTDPIAITVIPQAQRPSRRAPARQNPFAPFQRVDPQPTPEQVDPDARDLFIDVVPSTRNAVHNEQITIAYQLYFREGIQLRQSRLTDSWDAEGFWREEMEVEQRPIPQVVVRDGLRYNRITLMRAAVFPTRSGDLTVDPLRIESEAVLPSRSSDPMERFFSLQRRFQPVELSSAPLRLTVSPLPAGAPDEFQGAVGDLRFSAEFDRTELEVGESLQLTVRISGDGNLATLAPPAFEAPGAFERYDPQVSSSLDRTGQELRGSKTFTWVLVPRSNGTFEMPAVRYAWYDPGSGRYQRAGTEPVTITVTGTGTPAATVLALSGGLPVDDIAGPLTSASEWVPTNRAPLHTRMWPWLALLVPGLVVGGLALAGKRSRHLAANPALARLRRAGPLARKHLKAADARLDAQDPRGFYEALERALLGFVGNRLNVSEHGLTHESLEQVLAQHAVSATVSAELIAFLDRCDQARFSPVLPDAESLQQERAAAADLLVTLDDELKR